jgi:small GTP-binding protein
MQPQDINLTTDLKIIIIGKSGAGKTSFVNKWIKNTFDETYKSTIVSEYSSKIIKYADKIYHINLWDIAGQDNNAIITRTFSKNAHGCITMADATEPISLQETIKWKKELDDSEKFPDLGKIPNILIENKVDLIEGNDANDNSKLEEFAKENGFDGCFKTSAKTGLNINETINKLMSIIVTRLNSVAEKENDMNRKSLQVDPENHSEKDKYRTQQAGCC